MRVAVIREKKIQNIILNDATEGSYWVTETDSNGIERNLISIEADNGKWKLISNKRVFLLENNIIRNYAYLEENHFYLIRNDAEDYNFLLYCSPIITNYNYYEISEYIDKGIIVGSDNYALVRYSYLDKNCCLIKKMNNKIYVINQSQKDNIYINNARINKYKEIKNGDVVFILGLKIMYSVIKDNHGSDMHYLCINNIDNVNVTVNLISSSISAPLSTSYDEVEEETEYPLYDENEYFYKIPRFVKTVKQYDMNIDAPPGKQEEQGMPLLLTMGPMLTMSLTSMVTLYSTLSNVTSGNATWGSAAPSLVMCGAMLASVFVWPLVTKRYEKHRRKEKEKLRQKKYGEYIEKKRQEIIDVKKEQTEILLANCPPIEEVIKKIATRDISLWQRRIQDPDYMKINLGKGTYPMKIDVHYPEEHFTMDEDNLKKMVETLGSEPKLLENVPFEFSFIEHYISGLIGEEQTIGEYMRRLLIQILAFHSYDDLKIVIFTDEENEYQWKFLKMAPHLFSDDKKIRFFATNSDDHKEISYYLDRILVSRIENFGDSEISIDNFEQTYLIITDCFKKIRDLDFIKHILESKNNYGFSLFILDNKMIHLPDQCSSYIQLNNDKGEFYDSENFEGVIEFRADLDNDINYEDCVYRLANIPIEIENTDEGHIPNKLGFLEMYKVGKLEHLNIMNRWKMNDPTKSLRAPLGVNKQESIIYLDLHEKYHGPHGLIAGTTGSGKSEFIITYILSMAVNYSPNEVAFILIDYKGGGLAGAFENKKNNIRLPHLAGTITNLDKNEMNRTLVSIQSELTRRQTKFNEARDNLGESTIDIYKYQKFFREGKLSEPMPHLFIICDEFAELKQQQPDFMDNLISAARIGRSLGVHLILATQKPSGVVNDQIWSTTKFRVALKVANQADSNEIIKCPDAATIKNAGRFYLQVGMNEIFVLGQSGYCGTPYVPSEIVKKEYDRSVQFIDNIGNVVKSMDNKVENKTQIEDLGDELSNVLRYVTNIANKLNVKASNLWLDAIPSEIYLDELIAKYNFNSNIPTAIIGEYDDPSNQYQNILALPIDQESNTIVYGLSGNNREMFLKTFIYSICKIYSSDDINFYIFDFGSESFRIFSKLPHVGDVVFASETDKIDKMFKLIDGEILERKRTFADYNGDYDNYIKYSGNKVPRILVIFNNLESFKEQYSVYDDLMLIMSREGSRYGVNFLLATSSTSGLYSRFLKNFPNQFVLDMNSKDGYTDILGKIGNVYPADFPGRGLFKKDIAYEYQVAKICDEDKIVEFIKEQANILSKNNPNKAKAIPVLPDIITFDMLSDNLTSLKQVPLGIMKESLKTYNYNFIADKATIISSNELESLTGIVNNLLNSFRKLNNVVSVLFDFEDVFGELKPICNSYCNKDYENFIDEIVKYYEEKIKNSKYNIAFFITGVEKFKNNVSSLKIESLTKIIKGNDNCICLLIDENYKLKKLAFESWYLDMVINSNGIWVGQGVADQSVIKLNDYNKKYNIKIQNDFAWIIKNGNGNLIKLMNENEKQENSLNLLDK